MADTINIEKLITSVKRQDENAQQAIETLIPLVKKRDENAHRIFGEAMFKPYHKGVYRLALLIINEQGKPDDHENIVSHVFMKAWDDIDKYDPKRGSFRTWLNIMTRTACYDSLRKWKRNGGRFIHVPWEEEQKRIEPSLIQYEDLGGKLTADHACQIVQIYFDESDVNVQIFLRRYCDSRTFPEIAEEFNLNVKTATTRCDRVKLRIKVLLKEHGFEP